MIIDDVFFSLVIEKKNLTFYFLISIFMALEKFAIVNVIIVCIFYSTITCRSFIIFI